MKVIAIGILMSIAPVTLHWWRPVDGGAEYVTRNTLVHHHDRVCGGIIAPAQPGGPWEYYTLRSGGAHVGFDVDADTEADAKVAVEKDCR